MRIVLLLVILFVVLHFGVRLITPQYGKDLEARFLEASKTIPSIKERHLDNNDGALTTSNLALWLKDAGNDANRRRYVAPVILPFDVLYLLTIGSLLSWTSMLLAAQIGFLSTWLVLFWWIVPAIFMLCDLSEDSLIVTLLSWPHYLNEATFAALSGFTAAKLIALKVAAAQTGLLLLGWIATRFGLPG